MRILWIGSLSLVLFCRPAIAADPIPAPLFPRADRPFLEAFRAGNTPPVVAKDVEVRSAAGIVGAYLARPDVKEPLPIVLLAFAEPALSDWAKLATREIASIGYVALAV